MKLGAFSISLAVKDLKTSKKFYEKLGFTQYAGKMEMNYLIMKNGETIIGLFQGMFPDNIITFNPGWDQSANTLDEFDDIRTLQKSLEKSGIKSQKIETGDGPGSFTIKDPDGNTILLDQHV